MIVYSTIFLLVVGAQLISSQDDNIPEKCRRPPNIQKPHKCCTPPPIFPEEDMTECGIGKPKEHQRFDPSDCSKQYCLMKKHNLTANNKLDLKAMKDFVDVYASKNEDMKPVIEEAKACIRENLPGPQHICVPNRIMFCVGMVVTRKCPEKYWEQSDDCKILRDHIDECHPYFERHHNKPPKNIA